MLASVNLSCACSSLDVLARVADEDGIAVISEGEDGDLLWAARRDDVLRHLLGARPDQLLNRIPGMSVACEKLQTHAALSSGCPLPFWPMTWAYIGVKVDQLCARIFSELPSGARVIVKPSRTSKGVGIVIACSKDELRRALLGIPQCLRQAAGGEQDLLRITDDAIIQQYIDPPFLLGGLKFDFRLYVFICPADEQSQSLDEFGPAFLCREGLARFCTKPYPQTSDCRAGWETAHLTNTSVSKTSATFERATCLDDGSSGSKRKVSSVLECLEKSGSLDVSKFWGSIEALVSTVLRRISAAVYEAAVAKDTYETPPVPNICGQRCVQVAPERFGQAFNLLGFDVILDTRGEPFLLEVNAAPSLAIDDVVPMEGLSGGACSQRHKGRPRWAVSHGGSDWGQRCRCQDMCSRHTHELSPIDVEIKSEVVRGAMRILQARARGDRPARWPDGTKFTSLHGVPTRFL
mmetsp:Transcript_40472/g.101652  ORF Transcript_40472/g.101652 Transcript_40472/m.101652 type:complete len:464 (-) Transcript_40472:53-1444(-)